MFFYLSKILWLLIDPANILFLGLILATVLMFTRYIVFAKKLLVGTMFLILFTTFVPTEKWLRTYLETRFQPIKNLPQQVTGIIVLGGSESAKLTQYWQQPILREAAERHIAFIKLARHYPQAKLLFLGGSGSLTEQQYKETDVARMVYRDVGIDLKRIIFDARPRNTYEAAVYGKDSGKPQKGDLWIVITSAAHIPRTVGVFRRAGWSVLPYPVDFRTIPGWMNEFKFRPFQGIISLSKILREYVGLLFYYLTDKSSTLLPSASITETTSILCWGLMACI